MFPAVQFAANELSRRLADSVNSEYEVEPGEQYSPDQITNLIYEISKKTAELLANLLLPQNGPISQSPEGLVAHKAAIIALAALFGELAVATVE